MADAPPQSSGPEDTLASVQRALALLHQLQCSVSGFQLPSQLVLLERLNGLVTELGNMHSAAQDCHIQIPTEVLNFIDEGRNPDEFTKQLLNGCVQQNQASKGKVDSFKVLRKHLLEQVEEVFPVETEAYREIRSQSSLELRRATHAGNALSNGRGQEEEHHQGTLNRIVETTTAVGDSKMIIKHHRNGSYILGSSNAVLGQSNN